MPPPSENHGGVLVPLTDKEAYVELLNGKRVTKGKVSETNIVAYLLQPDLKTPLSETPKSVQVKIGTPKGEQLVTLKAGTGLDRSGWELLASSRHPVLTS